MQLKVSSEKFSVKTPVFEGPLDLLLDLIEKRKLLINEVSLAQIADDYIVHVKGLEQYPIASSAHFILIASTLLLIKSRSLLPQLKLTEEEEQSISDLEHRLKIYREMRELSRDIAARFGKQIIFPPETRKFDPVFSPDKDTNTNSLFSAIQSVLKNLPKTESLPQTVVKKVISLEEMIGRLTERVQGALKMSFKDFAGARGAIGKEKKVEIIVSFLAMLELVKQGIISVIQESRSNDILMETKEVGVPRY